MVPDHRVSRDDPSQDKTPSKQLQTRSNLEPHELEETLRGNKRCVELRQTWHGTALCTRVSPQSTSP